MQRTARACSANTYFGRAKVEVWDERPCTHPGVGLAYAMIASLAGLGREQSDEGGPNPPESHRLHDSARVRLAAFEFLGGFEGF